MPVLALCPVAALAGHTTLAAISQFGRLRKHRLAPALGFERGTIPAASALSDLLRELGAEHPDAPRVLASPRCHWSIEDGSHGVRDVTLGGDRCRVREGNAPPVLASVRNVAVYRLNRMSAPTIAAATREIAADPYKAIPWLNDPTSTSE